MDMSLSKLREVVKDRKRGLLQPIGLQRWTQLNDWTTTTKVTSHSKGNTEVGSLSLLQCIFPTQESNWGLLHCRQLLYQLSYLGKLNNFPTTAARVYWCDSLWRWGLNPQKWVSCKGMLILCYIKCFLSLRTCYRQKGPLSATGSRVSRSVLLLSLQPCGR